MSHALNALKAKVGLAFKREGLVLQGKDVMDYLLAQLKEHRWRLCLGVGAALTISQR